MHERFRVGIGRKRDAVADEALSDDSDEEVEPEPPLQADINSATTTNIATNFTLHKRRRGTILTDIFRVSIILFSSSLMVLFIFVIFILQNIFNCYPSHHSRGIIMRAMMRGKDNPNINS